ncbi:hypothetical protein LshimejAT787_0704210 [Lyophyllum shimeji]|uniref:Uncharacterized protein n=1 Tax=Lyophyllum shimeji TaxID=47721 RepID=A0A9P3UR59_LYOSH|nr:hypothetical protein LshimejAT787_0704210 [Lyophyllum shimeji]
MDNLPVDFNHPVVRDYLALVRLQVLTPLSLLINVATLIVCSLVTTPTISRVFHRNPTAISPHTESIAVYVIVIFVCQLGYCFLLVLARKQKTKMTLIKACGHPLVLSNWVMALWAIMFVFEWFIAASVFQGILLVLLLYSNIVLLIYHPPSWERPLDIALIHAPLRFFLALPMMILFPYCLLYPVVGTPILPEEPGEGPKKYSAWHAWLGFAVVMPTNFVAFLVVAIRRDLVFCIAATWLCISLWLERPKPAPVNITVIVFTALHPLAFICSYGYKIYHERTGRRIQLPGHDEALHPESDPRRRRQRQRDSDSTAREIIAEEEWGDQEDGV